MVYYLKVTAVKIKESRAIIQYDHLEKYIVPEQIIMESTELKELK